MKISFDVPDEFPLTALACVALSFQCFIMAFLIVVPARYKYFSNEHMKTHFAKEHAVAFPGQRAPIMGFPDAGSGRFSESLSYKDWISFNNANRAHLNIFEQLHFLIPTILVSALFLPTLTLYAAWAGVFSRAAYVIGYVIYGPNARMLGAFFNLIPVYGLLAYSMYVMGKHVATNGLIFITA